MSTDHHDDCDDDACNQHHIHDEHQHYEVHCPDCHALTRTPEPLCWCPGCSCTDIVSIDVHERAKALAALVPGIVAAVDMDT